MYASKQAIAHIVFLLQRKKKEAASSRHHLPHPRRLQPGIYGSPPSILAASMVGGGGDLGPALGIVEGP
jgi:hypothetical protein